MDKRTILQTIYNAIIVNWGNINSSSLFNGAMGVCLFFYEYSNYMPSLMCEHKADRLLDKLYHISGETLPCAIENGYGGVGIGLLRLFESEKIKGDINIVLEDFDKMLLEHPEQRIKEDILHGSSAFSSILYLVDRLKFTKLERGLEWLDSVLDICLKYLHGDFHSLYCNDLRMEFSIVWSLKQIAKLHMEYEQKIMLSLLQIDKCLLYSHIELRQRCAKEVDANLWWLYLYRCKVDELTMDSLVKQLNYLFDNFEFYINDINGRLAAIGLSILNHCKKREDEVYSSI